MTLSQGRTYLAIPGPSVAPDRVLNAMHRAAPNIYEGPLHDMVDTLYPDLMRVAQSSGQAAIYIGNGHAGWEAALCNLFSRGDRVLVLANGTFGLGWANAARGLGIEVELLDFGRRDAADPDRLEQALRADRSGRFKAVLCVHTDTASTLRNDIRALRGAIDAAGHPALLAVDAIASLGCDRVETDDWGVDVLISSSQKGLMMPPGLAFLWFNARARACHESAGLNTPYWDWTPRTEGDSFYQKFCGTAPTQHLYGLREALDMLLNEEGLEAAWARHATLARAVWAALEAWGAGGPMEINVRDPERRSHSVTAVRIGAPHGTALRKWCEQRAGLTLGVGLGMQTDADPEGDGFFRIAHMGHVNAHMTLGALAVIDAGLKALGIPHGSGALDAAADVVAGA